MDDASDVVEFNEDGAGEIRAAMESFRHPADAMEAPERGALHAELAMMMQPLFFWISKGRLGSTLDIRAWVVLRETNLSYVDGESIETFASRRGVSAVRVHTIVKEFRAAFPHHRSATTRKPDEQIRRMRASQRARADRAKVAAMPTPTPPGKESFSPSPLRTGSAQT